jgi:Peptide methionine sulfoxide reductase
MRRREFIARLGAAGAGGTLANTYKQVCSNTTGHAEVVQVTHDPAKASSDRLLDVWPCQRQIGNIPIGRRRADQARTSPNTWKAPMAATRPSFATRRTASIGVRGRCARMARRLHTEIANGKKT